MDASSVSNDSPDYLRGRSWSLVYNLAKSLWLLPTYHIEAHSVLIRHLQESNLPPRDSGLYPTNQCAWSECASIWPDWGSYIVLPVVQLYYPLTEQSALRIVSSYHIETHYAFTSNPSPAKGAGILGTN